VSRQPERLSIIVPVYNEARTVRAVIDRLLTIDLPVPREILVVDDGSTDGTGDVLDKALTGDNKMSLNSLFDAPGQPGSLSMADFRDADTFVQAVGKLLVHAPKFLTDSYCIWLNVPDFQRDLVTRVWTLPESEGGLSDDDGIEIIEIFIDQNYEALDAFFREKLGRIQQRAQQRAEAATTSRQSRR